MTETEKKIRALGPYETMGNGRRTVQRRGDRYGLYAYDAMHRIEAKTETPEAKGAALWLEEAPR